MCPVIIHAHCIIFYIYTFYCYRSSHKESSTSDDESVTDTPEQLSADDKTEIEQAPGETSHQEEMASSSSLGLGKTVAMIYLLEPLLYRLDSLCR